MEGGKYMDIKNISGINDINKISKTEKTKNLTKTEDVKRADSVEISSKARQSVEVQKYIDIVKGSADVRKEKVEAIKLRLKNGDYDKPEIYDKISERLMKKIEITDKILNSLSENDKE